MDGGSSRSSGRRSSGSKKTSRQSNFIDTGANTVQQQPEVGKLSENVIYIKTADGQYATLTVSKNATNDQILQWGKKHGVDMTPYLN